MSQSTLSWGTPLRVGGGRRGEMRGGGRGKGRERERDRDREARGRRGERRNAWWLIWHAAHTRFLNRRCLRRRNGSGLRLRIFRQSLQHSFSQNRVAYHLLHKSPPNSQLPFSPKWVPRHQSGKRRSNLQHRFNSPKRAPRHHSHKTQPNLHRAVSPNYFRIGCRIATAIFLPTWITIGWRISTATKITTLLKITLSVSLRTTNQTTAVYTATQTTTLPAVQIILELTSQTLSTVETITRATQTMTSSLQITTLVIIQIHLKPAQPRFYNDSTMVTRSTSPCIHPTPTTRPRTQKWTALLTPVLALSPVLKVIIGPPILQYTPNSSPTILIPTKPTIIWIATSLQTPISIATLTKILVHEPHNNIIVMFNTKNILVRNTTKPSRLMTRLMTWRS